MAERDVNEQIGCPNCRGAGCRTCGDEGTVPAWLADSEINPHAADWQVSL